MTPEEKAKELVDKYMSLLGYDLPSKAHEEYFKQCAIIAVDEIIAELKRIDIDTFFHSDPTCVQEWQQVKEAINKM
jgi:hypothetical protein